MISRCRPDARLHALTCQSSKSKVQGEKRHLNAPHHNIHIYIYIYIIYIYIYIYIIYIYMIEIDIVYEGI